MAQETGGFNYGEGLASCTDRIERLWRGPVPYIQTELTGGQMLGLACGQ